MRAIELTPISAWTYLLAYYLLTEYGIKQWLETGAVGSRGWSVPRYALFRAFHLVVTLIGTALLAPLDVRAVSLVLIIHFLGWMELPLATLDRFLRRRVGAHLRWLQALPLVGIALLTATWAHEAPLSHDAAALIVSVGQALPVVVIDLAQLGWYALGFAFLASPANHLVRCFVGKSPEGQLAYSVHRRARMTTLPTPEIAASRDAQIPGKIDEAAAENTTLRAGRAIGTLERWIMLTLILLGQYGLIGLVLTAKSIARFKKIEQDPEFAEYYLLGTLYSTLIAIVCGVVLSHV